MGRVDWWVIWFDGKFRKFEFRKLKNLKKIIASEKKNSQGFDMVECWFKSDVKNSANRSCSIFLNLFFQSNQFLTEIPPKIIIRPPNSVNINYKKNDKKRQRCTSFLVYWKKAKLFSLQHFTKIFFFTFLRSRKGEKSAMRK